MRLRILTTVSVGLLAAACQNTTNTSGISAATGSGLYASSNQACVDYGFVPNTAAYSRCVSSEQQARAIPLCVLQAAECSLSDIQALGAQVRTLRDRVLAHSH